MRNPINLIKGLLRWAVISSFGADDQDFPVHKMEYKGKVGDAISWFPYGYHANPGAGTLAVMLSIHGDFENRVSMPGSPKERIDDLMPTPLAEGEVIMYHPTTKSYVHFLADGSIDIDSQTDVNIRVVGNMLADVEGDITIDAAGDANIIAGGDVDVDATANIELDGVDITITASGNLRTLTDSAQFQNAAGSDDLHDTVSDFIQLLRDANVHDSGSFQADLAAIQTRINNMR